MESINSTLDSNSTKILAKQQNVVTATITFDDRNIQILNQDCLINILSYLSSMKDLISCKRINKYFCNVIETNLLLENLFLSKYYISKNKSIALPCNYLASINQQLSPQTMEVADKNIEITQESINLRNRLLFSIEKNLAQQKTISLKNVKTIQQNDTISSYAFSKGNVFFATASADIAIINRFVDGKWQQAYRIRHGRKIQQLLFSPDNNYLITSCNQYHRIWRTSIENYRFMGRIDHSYKHGSIFFRDDGKRLLIKINNTNIAILDLINDNWKVVLTIETLELSKIFNISQGKFTDALFLDESIKNDNWLSFIIQRQLVIAICDGYGDYGDRALADKLNNVIYGKYWDEGSMCRSECLNGVAIYSNDLRLIYVRMSQSSSFILEYTNNQWQVKLKFDGGDEYPSFSQNNQRIITGSSWGKNQIDSATVWNITGKKAYKELVLTDTYKAKFSPDGNYIIATNLNNQITIWHFMAGGWRIKTVAKNNYNADDVLFSDYNWVVATICNDSANILDVCGYHEQLTISENSQVTKKITYNEAISIRQTDNIFFSHFGNCFITVNNNLAQVWYFNTDNFNAVAILEHEDAITNVLFSPDNSHIIISSALYSTIWNITAKTVEKRLTIKTQKTPYISLTNDGKKLLIADDVTIRVFYLKNDNWQEELVINEITDFFEVKNGKFEIKPRMQQYNDDTWLNFELQRYTIIKISKKTLYFSPTENCTLLDKNRILNPVNFEEQIQSIIYTKQHIEHACINLPTPNLICYSNDNKLMYLGFFDQNCVILENNNGQWNKKIIFNAGVNKACFSFNNQRIITISNSNERSIARLIVWNISKNIAFQELGLNNIISANFSSDNNYLVTASTEDNTIKIWSLIDDYWQVCQSISTNKPPSYVNFSSDSKCVFIIYKDKTAKIYQLSKDTHAEVVN